ncbi:MAG: hypothetical protein K2M44_01700 [Clostridia bacterium]|nr:hypothetical protein [Clostridia bacterium]
MKKLSLMLLSLAVFTAVIVFGGCEHSNAPITGYKTPSDFHNMKCYTVTVGETMYKVVKEEDGITCLSGNEIYRWTDGTCVKYTVPEGSSFPNPNDSDRGGNTSGDKSDEDVKKGKSDAKGDGGNVITGEYVEGAVATVLSEEESKNTLSNFLLISGAMYTEMKGDDYIMLDYGGRYMAEPDKFLKAAHKGLYIARHGSEEGYDDYIKEQGGKLIGAKDDYEIVLDCSEKDTIKLTITNNVSMSISEYKFADIDAVNITLPDVEPNNR